MKTTLNRIRSYEPCADGWEKLLRRLGKTKADDDPLNLLVVLNSNGLDDCLWCFRAVDGHYKEMRLFAVWCAQQVRHLMADKRSIDALNVSERFANGKATVEELNTAKAAAGVAWSAANAANVAEAAARATGDAARASAWAAANAAEAAAESKQEERLREILKECGK